MKGVVVCAEPLPALAGAMRSASVARQSTPPEDWRRSEEIME